MTHWLTKCLTHHLLGHSPIQSLNWVTETRATHCSSNPFFHSSIHLKQLDTWINKNKFSHRFTSSLSHSFRPPDYQPKLIQLSDSLHSLGCTIINYLPLTHWSALLMAHPLKDRAHLSTFKIFIFEKLSCFIVLVVFLVVVQSSELISVWFCDKMTFFHNFFSYHIFAIYVGRASLGLLTAFRLIAVSGARLPSVDGLVVRCIKMHHHVKSTITICLQFI